jgi:hypothetical protein
MPRKTTPARKGEQSGKPLALKLHVWLFTDPNGLRLVVSRSPAAGTVDVVDHEAVRRIAGDFGSSSRIVLGAADLLGSYHNGTGPEHFRPDFTKTISLESAPDLFTALLIHTRCRPPAEELLLWDATHRLQVFDDTETGTIAQLQQRRQKLLDGLLSQNAATEFNDAVQHVRDSVTTQMTEALHQHLQWSHGVICTLGVVRLAFKQILQIFDAAHQETGYWSESLGVDEESSKLVLRKPNFVVEHEHKFSRDGDIDDVLFYQVFIDLVHDINNVIAEAKS